MPHRSEYHRANGAADVQERTCASRKRLDYDHGRSFSEVDLARRTSARQHTTRRRLPSGFAAKFSYYVKYLALDGRRSISPVSNMPHGRRHRASPSPWVVLASRKVRATRRETRQPSPSHPADGRTLVNAAAVTPSPNDPLRLRSRVHRMPCHSSHTRRIAASDPAGSPRGRFDRSRRMHDTLRRR